jgi:hypothetical protein
VRDGDLIKEIASVNEIYLRSGRYETARMIKRERSDGRYSSVRTNMLEMKHAGCFVASGGP